MFPMMIINITKKHFWMNVCANKLNRYNIDIEVS